MIHNINQITSILTNWDWPLFFNTVHHLGSQFNQPSWRMMKGEVVCMALEVASNGDAKYVDEVGYDLIIGNTRIEVKTEKRIIKPNLSTNAIQLKNTRGEIQVFNQNFDYLLIANTQPTYIAAFCDWDTVYRNHQLTGDQIRCKLQEEDIHYLTSINGVDIDQSLNVNEGALKDYIKNGIKEWIKEINGR